MVNNNHTYKIGDVALSCDIDTSRSAEIEAKRRSASYQVGDGTFIRRSDNIWRYAVVSKVSHGASPLITFTVANDGSTKKMGPRHWGDRLRPLKREMASLRKNGNTHSLHRKDGMGSSYHTQETSLFNSQSSVEREPTCVSDKSTYNGLDDPGNDPVELVDEILSIQRQRYAPMPKRRESIKDMAKDFFKKLSGESLERQLSVELADKITPAPEKSKTHDVWERTPGPIHNEDHPRNDKTPIAVKVAKSDATNKNQRKPNPRRSRGSFSLTTSLIFKNLMNGGDVLGDEASGFNRRKTVNFMADGEGLSATRQGRSDAPPTKGGNYKPRRGRRATFQLGKPSAAIPSQAGSQRAARSNNTNNDPSASLVMKSAFTQLLEEKLHLSQKQIVGSE